MSDDLEDMACGEWITAISAEADGEDPGVDPRLLAAHLERCAACRSFRDDVQGLRRTSVVGRAPQMPDLSGPVARSTAVADRAARSWVVRLLLGLVAAWIVLMAVPELLGRGGDSVHETRHVGAFSIAYGVALLAVVVRPARARAILPVALVLAGALLITAIVDVAEGQVPLVDETLHLPELVSVALVWLLARPLPDPGARPSEAAPDGPGLRLLRDDGSDEAREAG